MADTYKGESLQKKVARYYTHLVASESCHYFKDGLHVALASREGGDIGTLLGLGVPARNIVVIDREESAISACHSKWRDVAPDVELVHAPDAGLELAWIQNCLARGRGDAKTEDCGDSDCWVEQWSKKSANPFVASVFWDFCSHMSSATLAMCADTWTRLPIGGVFSAAFLKGRDKTQRATAFPVGSYVFRNRKARRGLPFTWSSDLQLMMRGLKEWDVRALLEKISASTAHHPAYSRWLLLQTLLTEASQSTAGMPMSLAIIEYQSRTRESCGVPMVIFSFRKGGDDGMPVGLRLDSKNVYEWRAKVLNKPEAHMLLNVPASTAAAWRAHATRGTYSRGRAA